MVQLSPDTRTDSWDGSSGYHHSDSRILGFSHTHLSGTGVGCLGDIMVMPTVGEPKLDEKGYSSRFSHANEVAKPGYYKVFLDDPKVTAELTSTTRAGYHRYTFPQGAKANLVVDLLHGVSNDARDTMLKIEDRYHVSGYRRSSGWGGERWVYFVMEFSHPITGTAWRTGSGSTESSTPPSWGRELSGKVVASLEFENAKGRTLDVKVGISATGVEGARLNLKSEIPGWGFERVRDAATKTWNQALSVATIETSDPKVRRKFYTNLYLSFLAPNTFSDADGAYYGGDDKIHRNPGFQNYSTFSLWDTYRSLHPLLTLTQPKRINDLVRSLVAGYQEFGQHNTPVWPLWGNETWCMIGYHSAPVIVDAYLKGFRGFDAEAAYQAMRDTAMQSRFGLDNYRKLGYFVSRPGDQATSKTIEYSVDDWTIAKMAEALGHHDDAKLFYRRAANYRNHFDRTTAFFRGRRANGEWRRPFDIYGHVGDEYTEADAWQYAFGAQHDVPGMIDLYGGDKGFVAKLDALFSAPSEIHTSIPDITGLIGQYAQGNEQCHHIVYLYAMAGQPWKTQARVREILSTLYRDEPDGLAGNIDCGQMSSWYVFGALGFYPVNPSSGQYILGSPVADRASISVGNGKRFTVIAKNQSAKNVYVQSASLNGKPLERTWISHREIVAGGTLEFVMGPRPNTRWGSTPNARPAPTMPREAYGPLPEPASDKPVVLPLPIRVIAGDGDPVGGWVIDPNMVEGMTNGTRVAIDTSAPNAAPASVYMSERYGRDFSYRFPVPKDGLYTVRLHFAELFDSQVGERVEDVLLNGQVVLKNFDILKEAGKINKAVVREFKGVRANPDGTITIRIRATPTSPDQNAKISGVEVLAE
jgi:predicted alpha-1,2-mannosidase